MATIEVDISIPQWYICWLFNIEDRKLETQTKDILVVCEFPNIFPIDLPGLAPHQEIDFSMDLLPGASPISKASY